MLKPSQVEAESLVEVLEVQADFMARLVALGKAVKIGEESGTSSKPLALMDFNEQISF